MRWVNPPIWSPARKATWHRTGACTPTPPCTNAMPRCCCATAPPPRPCSRCPTSSCGASHDPQARQARQGGHGECRRTTVRAHRLARAARADHGADRQALLPPGAHPGRHCRRDGPHALAGGAAAARGARVRHRARGHHSALDAARRAGKRAAAALRPARGAGAARHRRRRSDAEQRRAGGRPLPGQPAAEAATGGRVGGAGEWVGVWWGRTMRAMGGWLPVGWNEGVHVVLLNGAANLRDNDGPSHNVAERFAQAAKGTATLLPVPAIVGSSKTRQVLEEDPVIGAVMRLGRETTVACVGIGSLSERSVLVQSGYMDADSLQALLKAGAV